MIPWDYNLAFGTYSLGMPHPINDAQLYVNYPIDTPAHKEVLHNRPLYHQIMRQKAYFRQYRAYFDQFLTQYFESGYFEEEIARISAQIAPYVERDPTAFCSFEDHQLAVETIKEFCLLRAKSARGQLEGEIASTFNGQAKDSSNFIDASAVWLPDMGEIDDLKSK